MNMRTSDPDDLKLDLLRASLTGCPVVRIGDYPYFVHPVTDGIPRMDPDLLNEVVDAILQVGRFDCDIIVTAEAMGIQLAAPLSMRLGIPYSVVRKKMYGLPGEVHISQSTGYSKTEMSINGVSKGDRVTIVDDVLSTGGTLRAMVDGLRETGAEVTEAIVVFEKNGGTEILDLGVPVRTLVKVTVSNGRMVALD